MVFARWRQCAFPFGYIWRHIELVLPSVSPSLQSKRQIDPFSRSCTADGRKSIYLQWAVLPPTLPLAFLHRQPQSVPIYFTMGRSMPPQNCPLGDLVPGPPSNTWFLGPTRVLIPNSNSIGSAVLQGSLV